MGLIYNDIELINAVDVVFAQRNIISKESVKKVSLPMLVNSGVYMTAINETIQSQLELPFIEKRKVIMADSSIQEYEVAGPVHLKFANRTATCNVFVLPGDSKPLLGSIAIGEMDVVVDSLTQALIVNPEHPNYAVLKMK